MTFEQFRNYEHQETPEGIDYKLWQLSSLIDDRIGREEMAVEDKAESYSNMFALQDDLYRTMSWNLMDYNPDGTLRIDNVA